MLQDVDAIRVGKNRGPVGLRRSKKGYRLDGNVDMRRCEAVSCALEAERMVGTDVGGDSEPDRIGQGNVELDLLSDGNQCCEVSNCFFAKSGDFVFL